MFTWGSELENKLRLFPDIWPSHWKPFCSMEISFITFIHHNHIQWVGLFFRVDIWSFVHGISPTYLTTAGQNNQAVYF